jgi:putative transposase
LSGAGVCLGPPDDPAQPVSALTTGPEIIRLAVMLYVRFSLLLRNVENLLHTRGIEVSHKTVRF